MFWYCIIIIGLVLMFAGAIVHDKAIQHIKSNCKVSKNNRKYRVIQ